ncbi:MAG: hypothetical protein HFI37_05225 [Lachnospiraceae bacterium]|nr:hypothetical protein [Lachnospiraceae bacterium]
MAEYEFFRREYKFQGKHARMVSEMWTVNDYEHTYFKRLLDLYILAAVIGIRIERKAKPDRSPFEARTIFGEQMSHAKEELDFIMQMMILLEPEKEENHEKQIERAFRGVETKEEFEKYNEMFEQYVLGGVEELYERLVVHKPDVDTEYQDDKTANLMELLERFSPKNM